MNSIGEIIQKYRKENKLSQQELSKKLGKAGIVVNNRTISNWEKNISEPNPSTLMETCRILGITDIYTEYFGSNPGNLLSELNEEGKAKAIEYMNLLIDSGKYANNQTSIIPIKRTIRLFDIPVSAGTGNFLDGEEYTEIEVGNEVPSCADFGIRISGDSMEPQFVNGQIVWVKQQLTLQAGEIGIFYLDGNAYCKKLENKKGELSLISLNKKYSPIIISQTSSFQVFGKVVG